MASLYNVDAPVQFGKYDPTKSSHSQALLRVEIVPRASKTSRQASKQAREKQSMQLHTVPWDDWNQRIVAL